MKCHFAHTKDGKVLIPGCWNVIMSQNIEDCTCPKNLHIAHIEMLLKEGKTEDANKYRNIYKEQRRFNS